MPNVQNHLCLPPSMFGSQFNVRRPLSLPPPGLCRSQLPDAAASQPALPRRTVNQRDAPDPLVAIGLDLADVVAQARVIPTVLEQISGNDLARFADALGIPRLRGLSPLAARYSADHTAPMVRPAIDLGLF